MSQPITCTIETLFTDSTHAPHGITILSLAGEGPRETFNLHCASSSIDLWGLLCLHGQLPLTHLVRELVLEHEHVVEA